MIGVSETTWPKKFNPACRIDTSVDPPGRGGGLQPEGDDYGGSGEGNLLLSRPRGCVPSSWIMCFLLFSVVPSSWIMCA